jgi:hypothetical protein
LTSLTVLGRHVGEYKPTTVRTILLKKFQLNIAQYLAQATKLPEIQNDSYQRSGRCQTVTEPKSNSLAHFGSPLSLVATRNRCGLVNLSSISLPLPTKQRPRFPLPLAFSQIETLHLNRIEIAVTMKILYIGVSTHPPPGYRVPRADDMVVDSEE